MKTLEITENKITESGLFYIEKKYGIAKSSFVRTGKYKDGKLVGSELYQCSKGLALLFKSYEEARLFAGRYQAESCEILELKLADSNKDAVVEIKLAGELFGIKCYSILNMYKYTFKKRNNK